MNLLAILHWIGSTPVARAIDDVQWAFPVLESIHILGMALLAGTVVAVDLRLLGMGPKSRTIPEFARELQPWTLLGLGVMLATGPLLFSTDPIRYTGNPAFCFKMEALAAALVFHLTLHYGVALSPSRSSARWGRPAACLSLALWMAVIAAARWIATY